MRCTRGTSRSLNGKPSQSLSRRCSEYLPNTQVKHPVNNPVEREQHRAISTGSSLTLCSSIIYISVSLKHTHIYIYISIRIDAHTHTHTHTHSSFRATLFVEFKDSTSFLYILRSPINNNNNTTPTKETCMKKKQKKIVRSQGDTLMDHRIWNIRNTNINLGIYIL